MATSTAYGVANRGIPNGVANGADVAARRTPSGDAYDYMIGSPRHALAEEGAYLVATNPTPGTGVAYGSSATQATFSDTTGLFVIKNNALTSETNARRLFLDYVKILLTGTAPASATSLEYAIKVDGGASRAPTANASSITAVNLHTGYSTADVNVWCALTGVPTVPASSASARLVSRGKLRHTIPITSDEYEIRFGGTNASSFAGTATGRYVTNAPPVIVNPQEYCVIYAWLPSGATNAFTHEFEIGMWMR